MFQIKFNIGCFVSLADGAKFMEIDHDLRQVYCEQMKSANDIESLTEPTEETVSQRLTTPIVTTYVDTDKISFERSDFK